MELGARSGAARDGGSERDEDEGRLRRVVPLAPRLPSTRHWLARGHSRSTQQVLQARLRVPAPHPEPALAPRLASSPRGAHASSTTTSPSLEQQDELRVGPDVPRVRHQDRKPLLVVRQGRHRPILLLARPPEARASPFLLPSPFEERFELTPTLPCRSGRRTAASAGRARPTRSCGRSCRRTRRTTSSSTCTRRPASTRTPPSPAIAWRAPCRPPVASSPNN